ncbi:MAG TPA: HAD-IC family P-type ATPase [Methanocorpusculum sp.]|nr:HAD-IC family P-type ATPase [Methanocorpusculum sp.]
MAVVFDSAGTLLWTYRSVLSVIKHKILDESIETTTLTFQDPDRILVALNLHSCEIMKSNPDTLLSEYLTKTSVSFEISCGKPTIDSDIVGDILYRDNDATVADMQKTIQDCWGEISQQNDKFSFDSGAIINLRTQKIEFIIATAGYPFPGVQEMIYTLHKLGVAVFIASGDREEKLKIIAEDIGIPRERVHGVATPAKKAQIIQNLKKDYNVVVMIGDGINDLAAMKSADISILSVQQKGKRPKILFKNADYIVGNIYKTTKIIKEQLLQTRQKQNIPQKKSNPTDP